MEKKFLWVLAFIVSLFLFSTVFADSQACREGVEKVVKSLNLSDAQKEKIKPILENFKAKMKETGSQMDGLEQQLTTEMYSPTMDQNKINEIVDKKTKLLGDMIKERVIVTNQIFTNLDDKQKSKLQSTLKKEDERVANFFKGCYKD